MENIKQKLENLIKRNEELKPLIFKNYKTTKELDDYRKKNIKIFQEFNDNQEQIQQLEWELMTPEERKAEEELVEKMKLKREGKL
ncbi:hypothetical protein [Epilithonimonas sp.]|uniref:hypothetical protein n=1 Tax=Epilithonimonas sp. TaxID=2894511 RepID=UPI0035B110B0